MDSGKAKILILVEGAKTDARLMKRLLDIYEITRNHCIVSYNTNIYDLYQHMFEGNEPETMDILQLLKEREKDSAKKMIFDEKYSDILLIFDLDPQDPRFSSEKIGCMVDYFVESSDMGKLYLNYPMVESFYHMKSIPDDNFNSYITTMEELRNHEYKGRVKRENRNRNFVKFATTKNECCTVIRQNIEKANLIAGAEASEEGGELIADASSLLAAQINKMRMEESMFVLCTCVFYIPDYNPHLLGY